MNGRPLTDPQISQALRAHLPEHAQPGLRQRVLDEAEATTQLRGAAPRSLVLSVRRTQSHAGGACCSLRRCWSRWRSRAPPQSGLRGASSSGTRDRAQPRAAGRRPGVRPLELRAAAQAAAARPDVAGQRLDHGPHLRRSVGAVRFDQFASADATEPSAFRVLSGNRISGVATIGSDKVWVEDDGAIGEDPRIFLRTVLSADEGPGCEMERDPSEAGNGTAAGGWRYIGLEYVAGRPTHHVACIGDLWIDIETRLILRTQGPAVDDAGQPIPVEFTEVTEIAFGEQPAALFEPSEASPAGRRGITRRVSARGSPERDRARHLGPAARRLGRRRRHRRPSQARRPTSVPAQATARFRQTTRVSRPARLPGEQV